MFLQTMIRTCVKEDRDWEDGFPELEEIKKGWMGRKNGWIVMVAKLMRFVVPDAKDHIAAKLLSKWSAVASKALLFLNVENGHDAWMEKTFLSAHQFLHGQEHWTSVPWWNEMKFILYCGLRASLRSSLLAVSISYCYLCWIMAWRICNWENRHDRLLLKHDYRLFSVLYECGPSRCLWMSRRSRSNLHRCYIVVDRMRSIVTFT